MMLVPAAGSAWCHGEQICQFPCPVDSSSTRIRNLRMIAANPAFSLGWRTAEITRCLNVTALCQLQRTRAMFGWERSDYVYYSRKGGRSHFHKLVFFGTQRHNRLLTYL